MTLKDLIRDEITALAPLLSPMPLSRYMELCLTHPTFGYYMTRDPFGAMGDFTTAPEISQMFGELLGLWAVAEWQQLGSPEHFILLELGPGRGTLMADALRAASISPTFLEGMQLHLCDASPVLREHQHAHLARYQPQWIDDTTALPDLPLIVIANEFFDALPVEQVRHLHGESWQRRAVTWHNGALDWAVTGIPAASIPADIRAAALPDWREFSPLSAIIVAQLSQHIKRHSGSLLAIDYGYNQPAFTITQGDTLQALAKHKPVDVLAEPGHADLTCHVDFQALASVAAAEGLKTSVTPQGMFLKALGIETRAQRLLTQAKNVTQRQDISSALHRLTDASEMGELFKVLIIES